MRLVTENGEIIGYSGEINPLSEKKSHTMQRDQVLKQVEGQTRLGGQNLQRAGDQK